MEKIFRSEHQKKAAYFVFGVYLALLVWLVVFKFSTSLDDLPRLRGINLIPFRYICYAAVTSYHWKEVIYNILVFVPAGVYFSAFLAKKPVIIRIMPCAFLSLAFEIIQYIFAIGASDITDFIGNTLGGILGLLIFSLFGKVFPNQRMMIMNIIGIVIEMAGILLLAFLLLVNG